MRKKVLFIIFSAILIGLGLTVILFSDAHAGGGWDGVVLDKQTGKTIKGALIIRSWDRVISTPLGEDRILASLEEALSDENGKFKVLEKLPSKSIPSDLGLPSSIPVWFRIEENRPTVYKPGYRFQVLDDKPAAIELTQIPTIPYLRKKELDEASNYYSLRELGEPATFKEVLTNEKDFIGISLYLIDAQPLFDALKGDSKGVGQQDAVRLLAETLDPRATDALLGIVNDQTSKLERLALNALAKKKEACAIEPLIKGLGPSAGELHSSSAKALVQIGSPAVERLCSVLKNTCSAGRGDAVWALGEIKDPRAVEPLLSLLKNPRERFKGEIAEALCKINEKEAADSLIDVALRDPDYRVRQKAAEALEKIGYPGLNVVFAQSMADVSDVRAPVTLILNEQSGFRTDPIMEHEINGVKGEDYIPSLPVPKGTSLKYVCFDLGNYLKSIVYISAELQHENQGSRKIAHLNFGKAKDFKKNEQEYNSLRSHEGPNHRFVSVHQLAEAQDFRCIPFLVNALDDQDKEAGLEAAVALGKIKHPLAVKYLVSALKDEDVAVRRTAAAVLGEINNTIALAPVVGSTDNLAVGMKTSLILVRFRDSWIEDQLIAGMRHKSNKDRNILMEVLSKIKRREASNLLISVAKEIAEEGRNIPPRTFDTLVQIGEPSVTPLIAALHDDNRDIRWGAARALGKIGDPRAVDPLIASLKDNDERMRRIVCKSLGAIKDSRTVEPLIIASMTDDQSKVRGEALNTLVEMGPIAVEKLLQVLKGPSPYGRWRAAWALGRIRTAEAVEPLINTLNDEVPEVRWMAAVALGEIKDPKAIAPLDGLKNDEDLGIRSSAEFSLSRIRVK